MKCRKLECVKKASGQGGKWRNTFALEKCCSYGHAGFEVGAPITSFVKDGGHIDLFCTQSNNGTALFTASVCSQQPGTTLVPGVFFICKLLSWYIRLRLASEK